MNPTQQSLLCGLTLALAWGLAAPAAAAITVTGYAYGSEGPATLGATIEDFEDVNLIPGLRIRMGGVPTIGAREWIGTLPRTWNPSTSTTLGSPFSSNTWDGENALCNGGNYGPGQTGLSPGDGNFWDLPLADSVYFCFAPPVVQVGVGLSNFQSLSGPSAITNHQLLVNGVVKGNLESILPGWVPGINVRNRYLVVAAGGTDVIESICIRNIAAGDGLVFDKLAVHEQPVPSQPGTWGRIKATYRE